jgi:general stress protein 26
MTIDTETARQRLWSELDKQHLGMLGVHPHHFQPMTPFGEPELGKIWFFTRTDTDLARDVASGARAMLVLMSRDREMQACIGGELTVRLDHERLERWWSPFVAAWFPEGKDDPHLTMLCLDCEDARVWISDVGPIRYAWETFKANAAGRIPDVGGRTDLNLG